MRSSALPMLLLRFLLIPLMMVALTAQSTGGISMPLLGQPPGGIAQHAGHEEDQPADASACPPQDSHCLTTHQHSGHLCAFCLFCPGAAAITSSLSAAIARLGDAHLSAQAFNVRKVAVDPAYKPPKYVLV